MRFHGFCGTSALLGLIFASAACSSGSGPSSSSDEPDLTVDDISVSPMATWKLNRPIDIHFNKPIDFDSVNFNTIHIATLAGTSATGVFALVDPQTVQFQPSCPTLPDSSDAGLQPGGIQYRLQVLGTHGGGVTVLALDGEPLEAGISVDFLTPDSSDPQALFLDVVPGPPAPRIRGRSGVPLDAEGATYLELGGDPDDRLYFVWDPVNQVGELEEPEFPVPLNLYSRPEQQVAVVLFLNQPLEPSTANISTTFVQFEYLSSTSNWEPVGTDLTLVENCSDAGSALRLEPVGLLPQETELRVIIREGFGDIVGDRTLLDTVGFAQMVSDAPDHLPGDDLGEPADGADELLESFDSASLEDVEAASANPHADWNNGELVASFPFSGTGGPNGNFDWFIPPGTDFVLDTTSASITGGPGGDQTTTQSVINGVVDVRDLFLPGTSSIIIQGPNVCTILATGSVTIDGEIIVDGASSRGVTTLNTTNLPEPGAVGNAGGGKGGTGSYLTTQSTPRGGNAFGPFGQSNGGGQGGETSYSTAGIEARRGAGGGGGGLGPDVFYLFDENPSELVRCQELVGLDGEAGFGGGRDPGKGAESQSDRAQGGAKGSTPFFDGTEINDFLGTMLTATGELIVGELDQVQAAGGGGAGGNASHTDTFPAVPFDPTGDEKGAGGGGGAGGLRILAIGPIEVRQPSGRIRANGGQGGGGENTIGFNRVGGGSGGGGGGHVVLSSASFVSVEGNVTGSGEWYNDDLDTGHQPRIVSALGGQGGAGHNNKGGSKQNGDPVTWRCDAVPIAYFLTTDPKNPPIGDAACWTTANMPDQDDPLGPCLGAGGDGSPGILQIHVDDPALNLRFPDIVGSYGLAGAAGDDVSRACAPPPTGWKAGDLNLASDLMIPFFGKESVSRSTWIPLGLARVKSGDDNGLVEFFFDGTDPADGTVLRDVGEGKQTLPDPLIGPLTLGSPPVTPYIDADDPLTIVFDAAGLVGADEVYKRNAALLRLFELELEDSFDEDNVQHHDVAAAVYDSDVDQLLVTVFPDGNRTLADFTASGSTLVTLTPFFLKMNTSGASLEYPEDSEVTVSFEGTFADAEGNPDETATSGEVTDITDLNGADYDFFRFQVHFDLSSSGQPVDQTTPRPGLEFLRVPFRLLIP